MLIVWETLDHISLRISPDDDRPSKHAVKRSRLALHVTIPMRIFMVFDTYKIQNDKDG